MRTYWTEYQDEIKALSCYWCNKVSEDLFEFEGEAVCVECLKNTEIEEDESLTLEERNK